MCIRHFTPTGPPPASADDQRAIARAIRHAIAETRLVFPAVPPAAVELAASAAITTFLSVWVPAVLREAHAETPHV